MSDRFALLFARDAKKSLAELQPKQFKQIATKTSRFGHFSCWLRRINGKTIIDCGWHAKESQDRFLQI